MATIFLALPTHDGRIYVSTAQIAYGAAVSGDHRVMVVPRQSSLLPGNCNRLYTMCLNERREHGITWFAMLHSDIVPQPYYLDILLREAEEYHADMVSAVVAIKNQDGITSTAIGSGDDFGQFGRLTMHQLHHPDFPRTFDINMACNALQELPHPLRVEKPPRKYLLANTGCMIVRVDRPWSDDVCFRNLDAIMRSDDGTLQPRDMSEDWYFSREVARHGGRVFCTTKVVTKHIGALYFPNDSAWGNVPNDCGDRTARLELPVTIRGATPCTATV